MALKFRRGSNASRQTITPAEGELLYVTNHVDQAVSPLWIGDGSTAGGRAVQSVVSVNGQTGSIVLTTDSVTEGGTNKYLTQERAEDYAAGLFTNGVHAGGITFDYKDNLNRIDVTIPANGKVNSGLANELAYYSSTGDTVSATTGLSFNSGLLRVESGTITITAGNSPRPVLNLTTTVNSANANSMSFNRARGSSILPTQLTNLDALGSIAFRGYDGTQYQTGASINSYVSKTVSTGILPSSINFATTASDGELRTNLRALDTGMTAIGPYFASETGTGQLIITSTVNPQTNFYSNSVFAINTVFDGQDGQNFSISRGRGTLALQTAIQNGDDIIDLSFNGYDGTAITNSALITVQTDGPISSGVVPGAINISVRNRSGVSVSALRVSAPSTTSVGQVSVNGTITTTTTPATFWNYDTSGSTLTLTLGQVVTFANFSGSVLVNCHVSGNVSQYLCGSGGTPTCIGSSNAQTGTMATAPGSNGYSFTSTEAGVHSFYVIRTRTGA